MFQRFDPENHASLFLWRPLSKHFGNQKEILGGILDEREDYSHPVGFKVDERTDEDCVIQDDPTLSDYNIHNKMTILFNEAIEQINGQSNDENMMFTFGDDFAYGNAFANYEQIRKVIKGCNWLGKEYNISCQVSTPKDYVASLKQENATYPIKYDDFMNYYEREKDKANRTQYNFWSGFYTSRPGMKAHVKSASALYHAQSKIVAKKMLDESAKDSEI
jgi:alpha-mannosidase